MLTVEVTPRALAQLERAARWWEVNHPAAPGAIAADFEAPTKLLALQPGIGAQSTSARYPELRRLYLERVRYHIYYDIRPSKVVVLAFWHASRGEKPKAVSAATPNPSLHPTCVSRLRRLPHAGELQRWAAE